ncbi:MAG: RidA family protein [Comamonadaceae bacterium]|nr:RidA family protein [Comamonadaceae bacterium]
MMHIATRAAVAAAAACTPLAASQAPPTASAAAFAPVGRARRPRLRVGHPALPRRPPADVAAQAAQVLDELKVAPGRRRHVDRPRRLDVGVPGRRRRLRGAERRLGEALAVVAAGAGRPSSRSCPCRARGSMVSAVAAGARAPRAPWCCRRAGPRPPRRSATPCGRATRCFSSGLVPRRGADNTLVTGDIEAQTNAVFENADAILAAAGLTLADVVSARVFLTDGAVFERMNAAYRARLPDDPPARATVITPLVSRRLPDRDHHGRGRGARTRRRADAGRGRHAGQAEPEPQLGDPRRPAAVPLGHAGRAARQRARTPPAQTAETLNRLERTDGRRPASAGRTSPSPIVYVTDMSAAADVLKVFAGREPAAAAAPARSSAPGW